MNEDELRAIVRDAVARHLGGQPVAASPGSTPVAGTPSGAHASQALYLTVVNADDACVIEPTVRCEHCGYCRSHGF